MSSNENEEEILDKITEGHRRGEHHVRMAGCSLCTQQSAQQRVRREGDTPSDSAEWAIRSEGPRPGLFDLAAIRANRPPAAIEDGSETLGDVALEDAQVALDLLDKWPKGQQAIVRALVGVTRALVGIETAIRELGDTRDASPGGEAA